MEMTYYYVWNFIRLWLNHVTASLSWTALSVAIVILLYKGDTNNNTLAMKSLCYQYTSHKNDGAGSSSTDTDIARL